MPSLGPMSFFDSIRDTILMGVHQHNYEDSAFTFKIFREILAVNALNIMISSGETTLEEKSTLEAIRKIYIDCRNRGLTEPQLEDVAMWAQHIWAFEELFTNDTEARRIYIPPMTFQKLNDDRTVVKTHVLNDDGTKSFFEGSVAGAIPGLPEIRQGASREEYAVG